MNPDPVYFSAELGVFRNIVLLIATYDRFRFMLSSISKDDDGGSAKLGSKPIVRKSNRKATVILFGRFGIEEILMPQVVGDGMLITKPVGPEAGASSVNISAVMDALQKSSGGPALSDGYPGPPGVMQFLVYVLRAHSRLKFEPGLFEWWTDSECAYRVTSGAIFWELEWTPFVEYSPPVLSASQYRRILNG
ncbi:hypothetical protein ONS95_004693 [Cadophora gregata]|uniref:uncharacterized protein n=1 Tax=Cadophora gregata TaxID=51156 RepID=UPI0026DD4153|nr:uncharacterized protein ONS95_004693 [Cadophora gregata]KAK0099485.1 hypothetical protein ONS96_008322 [Cadophora gregata f. sp. sojae]KAK0104398.1 hypothetical protein ONS95_004693 [Cadophora gregata]